MTDSESPTLENLPRRLRQYQRERSPFWSAAPTAAAISYTAITFPALVTHREVPGFRYYSVAFLLTLLFHLQRRMADDLRNLAHDRRHQPGRPLPRGLVAPNELRAFFAAMLPVQALLCMTLDVRLLGPLLVTAVFLMLLTLGVGPLRWNRLHPMFYLFSHRLAAPVTLYCVTACEWLPRHGTPPRSLILLLTVSYLNSFVVEIGGNFALPGQGDPDARSYAKLWGPRRAAVIWWMLINLAAVLSSLSRILRGAQIEGLLVLLAGVLITGGFAYSLALKLPRNTERWFSLLSTCWTIAMFLTLAFR